MGGSVFTDNLKYCWKERIQFLKIVGVDIVFFACLLLFSYVVNQLLDYRIEYLKEFFYQSTSHYAILFVAAIIFILCILAIHAAFKLGVFRMIAEKNIELTNFFLFYRITVYIIGGTICITLLAMLLSNTVLVWILAPEYLSIFSKVINAMILIIIGSLGYLWHTGTTVLFLTSPKQSLRHAFEILKKRWYQCILLPAGIFLYIIATTLLFYPVLLFFRSFAENAVSMYQIMSNIYAALCMLVLFAYLKISLFRMVKRQ